MARGGGKFQNAAGQSRRVSMLFGLKRMKEVFWFFTGGEPLLQLDEPLIDAMHDVGFEIAIETNGTIGGPLAVWTGLRESQNGIAAGSQKGDELKVVIPQL